MTAIDYLVEQLQKEYKWFPSTQNELIIKAKEMEKKNIIESYRDGRSDQQSKEGRFYNRNAEYYYNQKFKK